MPITLEPGKTKRLDAQLVPLPDLLASLHGYITDASSPDTAIMGAMIAIAGPGGSYSAVSGSNGYYLISDIVPGTYSGSVTHPDYEDYPI